MHDLTLKALQSFPLQHPLVALFVGEGRAARQKAPALRYVDAHMARGGGLAMAPELQEPCPGGVLVVEVPITMQANSIAALAREFTLNGVGVILVAPGGCNGLHAALGITDERLTMDGEADLAPMVIAIWDDISFDRAYERLMRPNATLTLVRHRGAANG